MHQVWQSKDLKKTGTEEEVREYERKQEDPLSAMKFPYSTDKMGFILDSGGTELGLSSIDSFNARQRAALVAFANLAPLIANWKRLREKHFPQGSVWARGFDTPTKDAALDLLDAYDAACEVARQVNG